MYVKYIDEVDIYISSRSLCSSSQTQQSVFPIISFSSLSELPLSLSLLTLLDGMVPDRIVVVLKCLE